MGGLCLGDFPFTFCQQIEPTVFLSNSKIEQGCVSSWFSQHFWLWFNHIRAGGRESKLNWRETIRQVVITLRMRMNKSFLMERCFTSNPT